MTRSGCRPEYYDDLVQGRRLMHAAFGRTPAQARKPGGRLIAADRPSEAVYRLRTGWACRLRDWPDGRRTILDLYLPDDVVGLESALRERAEDDIVAVTTLTADSIDTTSSVPELLANRAGATYLAWLLAEQQRRVDRLAAATARLDAQSRLAMMLLELYERLSSRQLIATLSYNLPLTQQQIGDHVGLTLVHVNRVLRGLRESRIATLDRHVVVIRDIERLRRLSAGEVAAARGPREIERRAASSGSQMDEREAVARGEDLPDAAAVTDPPVGFVA
jgi:CRP/FNR family transcriptional regulator, anaerobic regulatory protein